MMWLIILALSICSCQAVKANCLRPPLENGFFVPHLEIYEHSITISYGCDIGWKPALKKWWGVMTCTDGMWSQTPQCVNETWCFTPRVPDAESVNGLESFYPSGEVVAFECNTGYEADGGKLEAQCVDGKWSVPECKKKRSSCVPPPRVDNGMIKQAYKDIFLHGESLDYFCAEGYKLKGGEYNLCDNGNWRNIIECERKTCSNPTVHNGIHVGGLKGSYNIGERVEFKCRKSYELEGTNFAVCVDGLWRLPVCKPRQEHTCDAPSVANAVPVAQLAPPYPTGRTVQFKCTRGYNFEATHYAVCENGHWKLPVCKQVGTRPGPETSMVTSPVRNCGDQPLIENGDVSEVQGDGQLKVQCKAFFKLQGPEKVSCVAGHWTALPVCKAPCKLDKKRFIPSRDTDEYLPEGEMKSFYCDRYYYYTITISCRDGQPIYSRCT